MIITVSDMAGKPLATFTEGCRTAIVYGPERTFAEAAWPTVTHGMYVRVLPSPWVPSLNISAVLDEVMIQSGFDALSAAYDYRGDGPLSMQYSPLGTDGLRHEGADWYDCLGVGWLNFSPAIEHRGCLDCSGFVRMIYGFRMGMPMSWDPKPGHLPRRSHELWTSAPGIQLAPTDQLLPGDLLFWNAQTDDGERIDHSGIYLGKDSNGARRFISSRKTPNGPTMGDLGAKSHIDGDGVYTKSFVGARRL